jgi:hypothetical protein
MILSALPAEATRKHTSTGIYDASCLKIANKYIVKTIIFSSFNNTDLSRSMLANCCMWRCLEEDTMVALVRWRPP